MLTTENLQYFTSKFYNKVKNDFVFKEDGKCLSTNDYTDEDKDKLTNAYTKTEVDNKLSTKSDSTHNHDSVYYTKSDVYTKTETDTKLSTKSDSSHTHDGRYYTETEIDNKLLTKSDTSHNHDGSYYKKAEVDNKVSAINGNISTLQTDLSNTNTKVDDLAEYVYAIHPLPRTMTVIIDKTDSNPETCITYADDAVGMTAGSDEWDSFFGHYPCLFKNGAEVGKLNPNNFAQFEDGTSANITSGSAGDVMIAFPKLGYKITSTDTTLTVSMTEKENAEGYCYLAHTRGTTVKDKFYLGAYKGYVSSNKLRSLSDKTPTGNTTISNFRTYAQANGSGYDQSAYNQLVFRQCMYLLKYKNLDSQTAVGQGYTSDFRFEPVSTGGTNAKGMDYGETTGKLQMKLFGLEDFWGNVYEFIDGIYIDSSRNILTATENFNDTGDGYTNQGSSGLSSNTNGYMTDVQGTSEKGFTLKANGGSSTTYYCDSSRLYHSRLIGFGGGWDDGAVAGAFCFLADYSASDTFPGLSARLMYL